MELWNADAFESSHRHANPANGKTDAGALLPH
jgi:hypothetical protein